MSYALEILSGKLSDADHVWSGGIFFISSSIEQKLSASIWHLIMYIH